MIKAIIKEIAKQYKLSYQPTDCTCDDNCSEVTVKASKEFVDILNKHNIPVKNHMSVLTEQQVTDFRKEYKKGEDTKVQPKAAPKAAAPKQETKAQKPQQPKQESKPQSKAQPDVYKRQVSTSSTYSRQ